jgi:hypothetical protein
MKGLYQTYIDIIDTIEDSLAKERIVPALILLYSAIDNFSRLANKEGCTGRKVFIDWVDRWMKGDIPSGEEIYSARCGLIHEAGSESDLTRNEKVRQVFYIWGDAKEEVMDYAIQKSPRPESIVAVRVEVLVKAFRTGMADCYDMIQRDGEWLELFQQKAEAYFVNIVQ